MENPSPQSCQLHYKGWVAARSISITAESSIDFRFSRAKIVSTQYTYFQKERERKPTCKHLCERVIESHILRNRNDLKA